MASAAFDEEVFPLVLAKRGGGPVTRTEIVSLGSAHEVTLARWATALRRYDAGWFVRTPGELEDARDFWEARRGRLRGFRLWDPFDDRSGAVRAAVTPFDQVLGTGDGVETEFQLRKSYVNGGRTVVREIRKPKVGTTRVAFGAVEQVSGWTLDTTTGVVTFDAAPGPGTTVRAGFEFHVPVRFDTDAFAFDPATPLPGTFLGLPLVEIRV